MKVFKLLILAGVFLSQYAYCQNRLSDTVKVELKDRVDSVCICHCEIRDDLEPQEIITVIDKSATFQKGDINTFRNYIQNCVSPLPVNLKNIKERLIVQFAIDYDGSLVDATIIKCNNVTFARKVLECLKKSPKWTPASQFGKKVKQQFIIPIVQ